MKLPRSVIGKEVKLTWLDPVGSERVDIEKALKGRAALASWVERGVIDDITEGVVRFRQSEATLAGQDKPDEAIFGWVPEDLITGCTVMVPETKEQSSE
jgi:hypothetical protein